MIEQLLDTKTILGLLGVAFAIYYTFTHIREHLDIVRLGGYAPRVRGFLPLGRTASLLHVGPKYSDWFGHRSRSRLSCIKSWSWSQGFGLLALAVLLGTPNRIRYRGNETCRPAVCWHYSTGILCHDHGNYLTRVYRFIYTADPENIKAALATQFAVSLPNIKQWSSS